MELFFLQYNKKGIQPAHAKKLGMVLDALNAAQNISELYLPSFKLHELKGNLTGTWSIWVSGNWRVTFRFAGSDVELVDYQDYH